MKIINANSRWWHRYHAFHVFYLILHSYHLYHVLRTQSYIGHRRPILPQTWPSLVQCTLLKYQTEFKGNRKKIFAGSQQKGGKSIFTIKKFHSFSIQTYHKIYRNFPMFKNFEGLKHIPPKNTRKKVSSATFFVH